MSLYVAGVGAGGYTLGGQSGEAGPRVMAAGRHLAENLVETVRVRPGAPWPCATSASHPVYPLMRPSTTHCNGARHVVFHIVHRCLPRHP
jgi:hypothetical protein